MRKNKTILLVEDEAIIALDQKRSLERYGYEVVTADSGEKAIESFERDDGIDLVLMDIDLGRGGDGTETAKTILERREVPVVFLSSHTEPEIVEKTEKITSYGYVVKRSGITVLDASIKMAFKLFEAHGEIEKHLVALRESEARFRRLFDQSPIGAAMISLDHRYLEVNEALCRMTGYSAAELVSKRTRDITHPDDLASNVELSRRLAAGEIEKYEMEKRYIRSDGTAIWARINVRLMRNDDGSPAYYLPTMEDITERKRIEELLERRLTSLTNPPDDSALIEFKDLFELEEIQRIQDEFSSATGVASIITRPDGTPLTAPSNFTHLCSDIIRGTETGRSNCFKSDATIGRHNPEGPIVQPCLSGGLWDAGASIVVGGRHIANWMIGQVRDETQTEASMIAYARAIGAEESSFMRAFREVPAMSRERFARIAKLLFSFAGQLSSAAYRNVQQARFINERKLVEERLGAERKLLQTIIDSIPDRIYVKDLDKRFVLNNDAHVRALGADSKAAALGLTDHDFKRRDLADLYMADDDSVTRTGLPILGREEEAVLPSGERGWLLTTKIPLRDAGGGIIGLVGISRDITERKAAADALEQSARDKQDLLDELQHRAKNSFDLIAGMIRLASGEGLSDETRRVLEELDSRVDSISELYSLLFSTGSSIELRLDEYCARIAASLVELSPNIHLEMELESIAVPAKDAAPIGLILTELMTNAVKYAFPEGRPGTVAVGLRKSAGALLLEVKDDGIGLPADFDLSRNAGLGLSIVQALSGQVRGRFRIERGEETRCILEFAPSREVDS